MYIFRNLVSIKVFISILLALLAGLLFDDLSDYYVPNKWHFESGEIAKGKIDTIRYVEEVRNEYSYTFSDGLQLHCGKAYGWVDTILTYGDSITVEFNSANPSISRIAGMDAYSKSKAEVLIFGLILIVVFLGSIIALFKFTFTREERSVDRVKMISSPNYKHPEAESKLKHRPIKLAFFKNDLLFNIFIWIF
jgi:hypothetical protein